MCIDRVVPLFTAPVLTGEVGTPKPIVGGRGELGNLFKTAVEKHLGPHAFHLESKAKLNKVAAQNVADGLVYRDSEDLFAELKIRKICLGLHLITSFPRNAWAFGRT